jgi:hypothetical protein
MDLDGLVIRWAGLGYIVAHPGPPTVYASGCCCVRLRPVCPYPIRSDKQVCVAWTWIHFGSEAHACS